MKLPAVTVYSIVALTLAFPERRASPECTTTSIFPTLTVVIGANDPGWTAPSPTTLTLPCESATKSLPGTWVPPAVTQTISPASSADQGNPGSPAGGASTPVAVTPVKPTTETTKPSVVVVAAAEIVSIDKIAVCLIGLVGLYNIL